MERLSHTDRVMRTRLFPLTAENADRAETLVSSFPEKCSTPFLSEQRNPIDLAVKTWLQGPNLKTIQQMLNGEAPIMCPLKKTRRGSF